MVKQFRNKGFSSGTFAILPLPPIFSNFLLFLKHFGCNCSKYQVCSLTKSMLNKFESADKFHMILWQLLQLEGKINGDFKTTS